MNTASPADKLKLMMQIAYGCLALGAILPNIMSTGGILSLVGVIIAFIKKPEAIGTIYESHCTWIIRTFVVAFSAMVIAIVLVGVLGALTRLLIFAVTLWALYRLIKGGMRLMEGKPVENPEKWV